MTRALKKRFEGDADDMVKGMKR